jgi:hypothetical protein
MRITKGTWMTFATGTVTKGSRSPSVLEEQSWVQSWPPTVYAWTSVCSIRKRYALNWIANWLVYWIANWLVYGIVNWLVYWIVNWLVYWIVNWLVYWIENWLVYWILIFPF